MASEDQLQQDIRDRDKIIKKLKKEKLKLEQDIDDVFSWNRYIRCRECKHLHSIGYICLCGCDNSVPSEKK